MITTKHFEHLIITVNWHIFSHWFSVSCKSIEDKCSNELVDGCCCISSLQVASNSNIQQPIFQFLTTIILTGDNMVQSHVTNDIKCIDETPPTFCIFTFMFKLHQNYRKYASDTYLVNLYLYLFVVKHNQQFLSTRSLRDIHILFNFYPDKKMTNLNCNCKFTSNFTNKEQLLRVCYLICSILFDNEFML